MPPALMVLAEDVGTGVRGLTEDPAVADALLGRALDLARSVGGVGRVLLFAPATAEPDLTARALGFRLWPADGGSPGARVAAAFRQASELGYEGAVVLGLRAANLAPDRLAEVAALLAEHQGVVVGDGDGRVAVLALQRHEPTLLTPDPEVPSLEVLETRARQLRVRLHVLPPHPVLTAGSVAGWLDGGA